MLGAGPAVVGVSSARTARELFFFWRPDSRERMFCSAPAEPTELRRCLHNRP